MSFPDMNVFNYKAKLVPSRWHGLL